MKYLFRVVMACLALFHQRVYSMALMNQKYPSLEEMAKNMALDVGSIEVVKWEWYDFNQYPTAGIGQLPFFITAQGQGQSASTGTAAAAVKTIADTNMTGAGVLPAPQAFWTEEIEVLCEPGSVSTANTFTAQNPSSITVAAAATVQAGEHDVNAIYSSGMLQFSVSQKPYYQVAPLYRVPPNTRVQIDMALGDNSATANEVVKAKLYATGDTLKLDPGVGIMTAQNFQVLLQWPVIVPTPSGFNAKIGVCISGWLFRAVQ